ncbi:hypothetical protein BJV82DRAFT_594397 [Fennellomyces sp. T-0311]|nr:hypothetical protein BJV82DRAFT_594397 [Fennellomyces sp. T-0311]
MPQPWLSQSRTQMQHNEPRQHRQFQYCTHDSFYDDCEGRPGLPPLPTRSNNNQATQDPRRVIQKDEWACFSFFLPQACFHSPNAEYIYMQNIFKDAPYVFLLRPIIPPAT